MRRTFRVSPDPKRQTPNRKAPTRPDSAPVAAGLSAGATAFAPARAADVVSSNIVGYNKVTLTGGYELLGSQFLNIGQEVQTMSELMPTTPLAGMTTSFAFQTTLRIWDGTGYDTYGWSDADDGTAMSMPDWNGVWLKEDFSSVADFDMAPGSGFWIYSPGEATVTFAGEVPQEATTDIDVPSGFSIVSNPFPEVLNIQTIQSSNLTGMTSSFAFQTTLRIWDGTGYDTYGWCDADDGTAMGMPSWNSTWLKEDFSDATDVTIGIGKAFWINTPAAATITFTK